MFNLLFNCGKCSNMLGVKYKKGLTTATQKCKKCGANFEIGCEIDNDMWDEPVPVITYIKEV